MKPGDRVIAHTMRYFKGSDYAKVNDREGVIVAECGPVFDDHVDVIFTGFGRRNKSSITLMMRKDDLEMKKESELPEGIFFDGEVYFSTCPDCGHEQGDMGNNVACEECGGGPMPTMDLIE